jgi:hypothetical protein
MVNSCCHSNKAINYVYFNIHGIKVHHFKIGLDQCSSKTFYIPQKSFTNLLTLRMMEVGTFIFTPIWWNLCIRKWGKQNSFTKLQPWNNCSSASIIKLGHWDMKKNYKGHEMQVLACAPLIRENYLMNITIQSRNGTIKIVFLCYNNLVWGRSWANWLLFIYYFLK